MTLEQAEAIFQAYAALLNDESKRGSRQLPSLLPAPKDEIMRSIWMLIARAYYRGIDNENTLKPLLQSAMFLDSFNEDAPDSLQFVESMQSRRRQVLDFYQALLDIRREDPFFWQRVYALAGVSTETKRTTFFEHIKERLGVVARTKQPTAPPTTH